MGQSTCTFSGCEKPTFAKRLCAGHYAQQRRGEKLRTLSTAPGQSLNRFWNNVHKLDESECWEWQGPKLDSGYGRTSIDGEKDLAHRMVWRLTLGGIPDGTVIDHTCSNRGCVNPSHLRAVEQQINAADRAYFPRNTSGYRNVHYDKARDAWAGVFRHNYKKVFVGRFPTPAEASRAVQERKMEVYGSKFRDSLDGTL